MKQRAWYRVVNQADGEAADLYIFDVIGKSWWDDAAVGQEQFLREVQALPDSIKTIRLHISSPGGNPFDAVTIANTLRNEVRAKGRRIEVSIEGLAASAASVVAMAGDTIRMADNALVMIHEASGFSFGPKSEMRRAAEMLDNIDRSIVATYRWHTALEEAEITALMEAVTWMDAATALEKGFVTEIVAGMPVAARFRPEALAHLGTIPDACRPAVAALTAAPQAAEDEPQEPDENGNCPEGWEKGADGMCRMMSAETRAAARAAVKLADPKAVFAACKAAGCMELADDLLGLPLDQVQARIAAAREIRGLCATAKLPELAAGYIQARTPADVVRAQLTMLTARLDRAEIDGHLPPDERRSGSRPTIDTAAIYAARNQGSTTKGA